MTSGTHDPRSCRDPPKWSAPQVGLAIPVQVEGTKFFQSQFSPLDGGRHAAGGGNPQDDRRSSPQASLGTFKDSSHTGHFWSSLFLAIVPHWAENDVQSLVKCSSAGDAEHWPPPLDEL